VIAELEAEPAGDERVGPYLLYDDEREVEIVSERDLSTSRPGAPRQSLRATAALALDLLRTCVHDDVAAPRRAVPAWWTALRPATLPLTAASLAIGLLLAVAGGSPSADGIARSALSIVGLSALALVGALALHAGVDFAHGWLGTRRAAGEGTAAESDAGSAAHPLPAFLHRRRGIGELAAALVWGPLLVVAAYWALAGDAPAWVWLASLPFGLVVGAVAIAGNVDEMRADPEAAAGTLPARIGIARAAHLAVVSNEMAIIGLALLVLAGLVGPWALLVLLAQPRLRRFAVAAAANPTSSSPTAEPPTRLAALQMRVARAAAGLLVLGLALNALLGAPA
jgi:1,4-dihydroxy-2-naphthoate octaprenyltransferase